MLQETSKRVATSPVGGPDRDPKRLRLATDLWSEDEHLQQDKIVNQELGEDYDIDNRRDMSIVLKHVAEVASKGPHSHLFHGPDPRITSFALKENPALMKLVGDCYTKGSYKDIRCLEFLRKKPASAFTQNLADVSSSYSATEKAWNEDYVGSAADCLYDTITGHCASGDPAVYARYASILQSSGMGKSRMIDELSKKHLVLPINLQSPSDIGFPAADVDVRAFLTVDETETDKILR